MTEWDGRCSNCGSIRFVNIIRDVYECQDCGQRINLDDLEEEE